MGSKIFGFCENKGKHEVYTKEQTDNLLAGKANSVHTHDDRYYTETEMKTTLENYKLKGDFAVITGSLDKGNDTSISYPSGFTKDNCVVIAVQFQHPNKTEKWRTGSAFDSSNMFGSIPCKVVLQDTIVVTVRNLGFYTTGVTETEITVNMNYKLVLMKV